MQDVLDIEGRTLTLEDNFRDLDEWDSLAYLSTIAMIDDEYGVLIDSKTFRTLQTLGDIAKAIEERL